MKLFIKVLGFLITASDPGSKLYNHHLSVMILFVNPHHFILSPY